VPPLIFERRQFLDKEKNPYFHHADAEYLIAWRDGEPVGRITAQIDQRWDEFQGGEDGQFGLVEFEGDPEGSDALIGAAEHWTGDGGGQRLIGAMDFTTHGECGLLIEGFDVRPMILETWHPAYYQQHFEQRGYRKMMDLLMWYLRMGELK